MNRNKIGIAIGVILVVVIIGFTYVNLNKTQSTETSLRIGYLGIVDSVPIFSAIDQGYFENEGFNITTTKFQSSNDLLQALVNGNIDCAAGVSSQAVFALESKSPGNVKVIADITHPFSSPFSTVLVKNGSALTLSNLNGKKIAVFPGATSVTLSDISFKKLVNPDFKADYVQIPPNLWLNSLSSGQVDAVVTYEPFGTMGKETGLASILFKGLYEKYVMDDAPTALVLVKTDWAMKNPTSVHKIENIINKGIDFVQTNESQARLTAAKYIVIPDNIAAKMNLQKMYVGSYMNATAMQQYADILLNAGAYDNKIDVSTLVYKGQ